MDALTIHEAAQTTGWSPRMLRYVERIGLVEPARSDGGYRLYGAAELQRLRTLRELLEHFEVGLAEVGFAARQRRDPDLAAWLLREDLRHTLGERLGLPRDTPPEVLAQIVSTRLAIDEPRAQRALVDVPVGSEEGLVTLARDIEAIRQEVLHEHVSTH